MKLTFRPNSYIIVDGERIKYGLKEINKMDTERLVELAIMIVIMGGIFAGLIILVGGHI
jgi:hypothetical protein